jgi:hypothetical protein
MKKIFWIIILVVIIGAAFWIVKGNFQAANTNYKNSAYSVGGQIITFVNGYAETDFLQGSMSKTITRYFGNEAVGDLNGDSMPDVVFIITQTNGGSGTFYYVVAALKTKNGYQGTNAILLGDRIAPQTTEVGNGQIVVNYADRKPNETMTTKPSLGVSKYLQIKQGILIESARVVDVGEHCGGNITNAPVCSIGYHCTPVVGSNLPFGDIGGICVAN